MLTGRAQPGPRRMRQVPRITVQSIHVVRSSFAFDLRCQ